MPLPRVATPIALLLMLSACSGIGDGNKPESVRIVQSSASVDSTATGATVFTCVRDGLILIGEFSDGSLGDFSRRARWTSDDPAIVGVSNGEDEVPGEEELFFISGSLAPRSVGTTTVRAEFLGFTAAFNVTVKESADLRIVPGNPRLAPRSLLRLQATADLDGTVTSITNRVSFAIAPPNDAVATIGDDGFITAAGPGTVKVQAQLPCAAELSTDLNVSPLTGLELNYEDAVGFGTGTQIVGTGQLLRIFGTFGDLDGDGTADADERQDLSSSTAVTSSDSTIAVSGGILSANLVSALKAGGPVNLTATFGAALAVTDPDGDGPLTGTPAQPGVTSAPLPLTVADGTLMALSLNVKELCDPQLLVCEPGPTPGQPVSAQENRAIRFRAVGDFGAGVMQDLTKDVVWSSSVPNLVPIGSGRTVNAGLAVTLFTRDQEGQLPSDACVENTCTAVITARFIKGKTDDPSDPALPNTDTTDPKDVVQTISVVIMVSPLPEDAGP